MNNRGASTPYVRLRISRTDRTRRKIESLEEEVEVLKGKLEAFLESPDAQQVRIYAGGSGQVRLPSMVLPSTDQPTTQLSAHQSDPLLTPGNLLDVRTPAYYGQPQPLIASPNSFPPGTTRTKRKRSHFEIAPVTAPDIVTMGLISLQEAESYFKTFFQGCNQYMPVFGPSNDTMHDIRNRSSLLFCAICAVGCRVLSGTDSRKWHLLNLHIKRALNSVIGTPESATLETVQALLVRACYESEERSLLVTLAARLAIDLGLPEAYELLTTRYVARTGRGGESQARNVQEDAVLMRRARTWLHLLVLGHILHVDAGDLLAFKFRGDVRRCRVLLEEPSSTDLDLHLLSQVELNALRADAYTALSNSSNLSDDEIMDIVRDAKIDIDVWFNDWTRIFERYDTLGRRLTVNIRIQRCWADTMVLCRAVRVSGVENVDAMSPTQRRMLLMAKDALTEHLDIIIEEPREYLHNLPFAMDFVWAKCAFCLLLLLKLSTLLAEDDDEQEASRGLVDKGRTLLAELHRAGAMAGGGRSGTSRLYIQLLQTGIEKYSRTALGVDAAGPTDVSMTGLGTPRQRTDVAYGGQNELESFVPEQFVFEWDFPGLTLFSSPVTEAGWLDDFLRGTLVGEEFGLGWNPVDVG